MTVVQITTIIKRPVLAAIILFAISSAIQAESAPSFELPGVKSTVSLEDLRGSVVLIDFWASWCTPCRKSFPWMNELQARYKDHGLRIVAINLDESREAADIFLKQMNVDFTVAFDHQAETAEAYRVMAMPSSYLIDQYGNIAKSLLGFRHKDKIVIEQSIQKLLEIQG